ncbi:hypothetical protein [Pelagerythrobacter sp.]|uniref:hypothetical protein n=1 Tax=Pelagerythrobacter sp. TaxID=2800702 RepID=UPI0035AEE663
MSDTLETRIAQGLAVDVHPAVAAFAQRLAEEARAVAALFYGSNLRTGELDGVLDFYLLMPGEQAERIWPRVSYHEWAHEGRTLRAKVARMALGTFARAARGESRDTTIWARFVQPSALVWLEDEEWRAPVVSAVAGAAQTAARLAAALGPASGTAADYWRALFRATYRAEFRFETASRADAILSVNAAHFEGLLPLAWDAQGIAFAREGDRLTPALPPAERRRILRWWARRRRMGKPLNLARLVKASTTFDGAARYAAWKIERHTGVPVALTPWRERHPVLAAPGVLWQVWRARGKMR